MISFMFSASTSREIQKLALDVFQLSSASTLVLLVVRDAPASGYIASDCRSMIDTSMKENNDIRYKKVWIRKQEEQVNKDQVPEITRLTIKRDEENCTEKRKDVRYRKVWKINEIKEGQVNKE
jgi:hypothetical protein